MNNNIDDNSTASIGLNNTNCNVSASVGNLSVAGMEIRKINMLPSSN
jgi:hypothetical protein